ncbi:hypothetical protein [Zunongwangia endophytica]|uniref:DUF3098 domain-containing protein n=1 Tax=Zunongwangia endophytica TaxID=1808945 RepID=A0ABV8H6E9_9FLAO|nr:hypothetical protein [Zunongwangia endophytica]MDN3595013.1 hypothetical protein [Zunongwangia endophytica]
MSILSNPNKNQAKWLLVVGLILLAFGGSFEYFVGGYDSWNGAIYGFSFSLMIISIFTMAKLKTSKGN